MGPISIPTVVIIAIGGVTVGTMDGLELGAKVGILDIEGPTVGTEVGVAVEIDGLKLILDEGVLEIMILGFRVGILDGVKLICIEGRLVGEMDGFKPSSSEGMLVCARLQSPHVIGQSSLMVEVVAERAHLALLFFPTHEHDLS
jgi:hypothetical protein